MKFLNQINETSSWGLNARLQGLIIMPEGTITDNGAGVLTLGSSLIVMNPASGSYFRIASGSYTLGSFGYLYVIMPPSSSRGTAITPSVASWTDSDRPFDNKDMLIIAQRSGSGAIYLNTAVYTNLVNGNASTANTLATARTIATSGGATGTATSFNGSSNITVPITSLDPAYLSSAVPIAKGGTGSTTASGALTNLGLTATATELNYTDGVTSNIQTQLNNKTPFSTTYATTSATLGWYRIATSALNIGANSGLFKVEFSGTGVKGRCLFIASCHDGTSAGSAINQLGFTTTNASLGMTQVRVVYNTTNTGNYAYVEVYNPSALAITYTVDLIDSTGWTLVSPATTGTIPTGYTSETLILDTGFVSMEDVTATRQLVSKVATGTAPLSVTSTTVVTNLNVDKLDGYDATAFAPSGYGLGTTAKDISNTDLNVLKTTGFYRGYNMTNSPMVGWFYIIVMAHDNTWVVQYATGYGAGSTGNAPDYMYKRELINSVWSAWHTIYTSNNKPTKSDVGLGSVDNTADSAKNVLSATKLTTARNIALTGSVTGNANFDGSGNISISTTVTDDSHNHVISNVDNLQSTLDGKVPINPIHFGASNSGTARWAQLCRIQTNGVYVNLHERIMIQDRFGNGIILFEGSTGSAYNVGQGFTCTLQNMENNGYTASQVIIGQKTDTTAGVVYWDIWVNTNSWSDCYYQPLLHYFNGTGTTTYYNGVYSDTAPTTASGYDSISNPVTDIYVNGTKVSLVGHTHTSANITDATNSNTASTIVKRDASGNFSAGIITASLGGNASTATTLQFSRTIGINGGATGSATAFNGGSNITIPITAVDPSYLSTAVAITKGGTGATTASGALTNLGLTATATELNYCDGVTSNIQTQLDAKVSTSALGTVGVSGSQFGGDANAMLTADFITMLTGMGVFNKPYWITKAWWAYASNRYISDTGCGNIHLAGATVEVMSCGTTASDGYTIRIHTATTSSLSNVALNSEFYYVNNGSSYSPKWSRTLSAVNSGTFMTEDYLGANINFNTVLKSGCYRVDNNRTNAPAYSQDYGILFVGCASTIGGDTIFQIYADYSDGKMWTRTGWGLGANWTAWKCLTTQCGTSAPTSLADGEVFYVYE
jgi:hypothetical protein